MLVNNKYKKMYFKIIDAAILENRSKNNHYYENHHIIPKSLGGPNTKDNLVLLTGREHYICHKLLTKCTENKNKEKMFWAFWSFNRKSKNQKRQILNSRDYEYAKIFISKNNQNRKGKFKLSLEQREKISKSLKGKPKSETAKQKMKDSWKNRKPRTKDHCKAISNAKKGKPHSLETKQKMSSSKKGINPIHTQINWTCKCCGKNGIGISNYNRWHGNNCKNKEYA